MEPEEPELRLAGARGSAVGRGAALVGLAIAACGRMDYAALGIDGGAGLQDVPGTQDSAGRNDTAGLDSAAAPQGPADADDPTGPSCLPWTAATKFGAVEHLAAISSSDEEQQPYLLEDQRTLYFTRLTNGNWDVYASTRSQPGEPFGAAVPVLATADDDTAYAMQLDGLAIFVARRTPAAVSADLFEATRTSSAQAFGPFMPLESVNTPANEYDPHPSMDGLRVYFMRSDAISNLGDLAVAERAAPGAPFTTVQILTELSAGAVDSNPSISKDERLIVFASDRTRSAMDLDLYFATRADRTSPFDPPALVPGLNTLADESEVFVRPDGCEIFFTSNRPGGNGRFDLYRVDVLSR